MAKKPLLPHYIHDTAFKELSNLFDDKISEISAEVLAAFPEAIEAKFEDTLPRNEAELKDGIILAALAVVSAQTRDKVVAEQELMDAIRGYFIARGVPAEMPPETREPIQSVADAMVADIQRRKTEYQTAKVSGYLDKI